MGFLEWCHGRVGEIRVHPQAVRGDRTGSVSSAQSLCLFLINTTETAGRGHSGR